MELMPRIHHLQSFHTIRPWQPSQPAQRRIRLGSRGSATYVEQHGLLLRAHPQPIFRNSPGASAAQEPTSRPARRDALTTAWSAVLLSQLWNLSGQAQAAASKYESMEGIKGKDYGKARQRYPDYVLTDSGLQYQDIRQGTGPQPDQGSQVAVQWDGYTIGYYGRPFQARSKAKGGSFSSAQDLDLFRFQLGASKAIPAFEEAVAGMKQGGIRRIVVPVELGYPENDFNKRGPKPATFSGQRALDFVLKNKGLIDKTLLFDIELVRIS